MDSKTYYDSEEKKGRRRKNRPLLESSKNVVDFEVFILQKSYDEGGDWELKRVYDFYIRHGYEQLTANKNK